MSDSASTPGRSLIGAEYLQPERDGQVRVLLTCDCGTATDLTVQVEGKIARPQDAAFTCSGCGTSHWFTIVAAAGQDITDDKERDRD